MTEEQLAELNALLLPLGQAVRGEEGGTYRLYNLVPVETIADIAAFAAIYGVVV